MTAQHTKENQDGINLIAFYMLPVDIISGRRITILLYKMNQKLNWIVEEVFPVFP